MPAIGLTGNFGMGKTTVLKLFAKHGASAFSSDDIVHDILKKPAIARKLSLILGNKAFSKKARGISVNRKFIADQIFNDPEKRRLVEDIIHPEVQKHIIKLISLNSKKSNESIIVFEVPLLFETGFDSMFDYNVVVYCNRNTAISRLSGKGFSKTESIKRIRAQMPITKKKGLADLLINNEGNLSKTEQRVINIINKIQAL